MWPSCACCGQGPSRLQRPDHRAEPDGATAGMLQRLMLVDGDSGHGMVFVGFVDLELTSQETRVLCMCGRRVDGRGWQSSRQATAEITMVGSASLFFEASR